MKFQKKASGVHFILFSTKSLHGLLKLKKIKGGKKAFFFSVVLLDRVYLCLSDPTWDMLSERHVLCCRCRKVCVGDHIW